MEKQLKEALKVNIAYKKTFSTDEGKMVLMDLVKSSGMMASSFVANDPYATAFNEGARSIVVRLIDTIQIDPEKYIKMLEEYKSNQGEME
jgi:hypothetical protein